MDRLTWRRGEQPHSFAADLPGGGTALIYRGFGADQVTPEWRWRIDISGLCETSYGSPPDVQACADEVNRAWPAVAARAAEALAAQEDEKAIVGMIEAGLDHPVSIEAFQIETSSSDRLRTIMWHLRRHIGQSGGPPNLQPLIEAISAELYRRRITDARR